ncbi:MAG: hypothetical protein NTZ03_15420 [Actinobacteria bacterium]|nr:hypothetical protein [Actinomycetota bacterium]
MRLASAPTAEPADIVLDLDAGHWARQGRVAFEIDLTDGIIGSSDLIAGFMHRGAEKLFEVRDYRQGMALANRHDWLAPVGGEILLARAAEELLGMPVPRQGRLLRLLLLELSRAASMLAFLGPAAAPTGMPAADELRSKAAAAREELLELLELLTGARMHVTFSVVGGVRNDAPDEWLTTVIGTCERLQSEISSTFVDAVTSDAVTAVCAGLGVVSCESALGHGASGVVGRASGIALDLRQNDRDYAEIQHLLPHTEATTGDATARLIWMAAELRSALALSAELAQRVTHATDRAVNQTLPKVLRVPVGSTLQWLETPLGAAGALLESRGDRVPCRYALRTPSFAHAPLLAGALVGHRLDQAAAIVSSFPIVVGDLDK